MAKSNTQRIRTKKGTYRKLHLAWVPAEPRVGESIEINVSNEWTYCREIPCMRSRKFVKPKLVWIDGVDDAVVSLLIVAD